MQRHRLFKLPLLGLFTLLFLMGCQESSSSAEQGTTPPTGSEIETPIEGEEGTEPEEDIEDEGAFKLNVDPKREYAFNATLASGQTTPAAKLEAARTVLSGLLEKQRQFLEEHKNNEEKRAYFYDKKIFKTSPFDGFEVFTQQVVCLVPLYEAELTFYDVLLGWVQAEQTEGYAKAVETGLLDALAAYTEKTLAAVIRPFEAQNGDQFECAEFAGNTIDPQLIAMTPELSQNQVAERVATIINRAHLQVRYPLYKGEETDFDVADVFGSLTQLSQGLRAMGEAIGNEKAPLVENGAQPQSFFSLLENSDQKRPRQLVADVGASVYRVANMIDLQDSIASRLDDTVANNIYNMMLRMVNNVALAGWVNRRVSDDKKGDIIANLLDNVEQMKVDPDKGWTPSSSLFGSSEEVDKKAVDDAFELAETFTERYIEALPNMLGAWQWLLSAVLVMFGFMRRRLRTL
ncbi:MAG TPA: hypothetical protein VK099_05930 [Alcanivoracaceae bacterium]|nr:hypothetical protein [Alcanivoracaceae bacterium]